MGVLQRHYHNDTNHRDSRSIQHAGLNEIGMKAVRRLFVLARIRLVLITSSPRTVPLRAERCDKIN